MFCQTNWRLGQVFGHGIVLLVQWRRRWLCAQGPYAPRKKNRKRPSGLRPAEMKRRKYFFDCVFTRKRNRRLQWSMCATGEQLRLCVEEHRRIGCQCWRDNEVEARQGLELCWSSARIAKFQSVTTKVVCLLWLASLFKGARLQGVKSFHLCLSLIV